MDRTDAKELCVTKPAVLRRRLAIELAKYRYIAHLYTPVSRTGGINHNGAGQQQLQQLRLM